MLLHNLRNHEGICWSMSVVKTVPDLQDCLDAVWDVQSGSSGNQSGSSDQNAFILSAR